MSDKNEVPEISVDEIMAKIREEVGRRKQDTAGASQVIAHSSISAPSSINTAGIRSLISHAAANADAGATVTPMEQFSGLKQKLALFIGKVVIYLASFITDKQRRFNSLAINSLQAITDTLEKMNGEFSKRDEEIRQAVEALKNEYQERTAVAERLGGELAEAKAITERLGGELVEAKTIAERLGGELVEAKIVAERLGSELAEAKATYPDVKIISSEVRQLKLGIQDQQRRLTILLEEARRRLPEPFSREQIEIMAKEEDHMLDAMYVAFEDQFRGTREDIKGRLQVYLPYLEKIKDEMGDAPVLDVGCGRGEWLELLKENGYPALGIDQNRVMIQQCNELGFYVVDSEVIKYLQDQKPSSISVITGFHIIEHLPLKTLIALFDESLRVLKPGGMMIFETPNPENLIVGACNFYYDPTHNNPLPPEPIKFIAEQRGFVNTSILRLHRMKAPTLTGQGGVDEIVERLTMEQDYALMGYKA